MNFYKKLLAFIMGCALRLSVLFCVIFRNTGSGPLDQFHDVSIGYNLQMQNL